MANKDKQVKSSQREFHRDQLDKSDNPVPSVQPLTRVFQLINDDKPEVEAAKDDQDFIIGLMDDPRWKALKKIIDQRIEFLKQLIDPLSGEVIIDKDDTVEAVGFKFLIASTVIKYLEEVKNYPDILFEAVKNERSKEQSK